MANCITYEGCNFFRQRLILATLSGKTVKIKNIRPKDDNPGLRGFEANFVRLLDTITNGSKIVVSETGTSLLYQPGLLIGGDISHDCSLERGVGYYLEALLCLAPFTKKPLQGLLKGVTHDQIDPTVDLIKLSTFPVLRKFLGTNENLNIQIHKRGVAPSGGGKVSFSCPCRQKLRPVIFVKSGKVKRIRGIAWTVRASPATSSRIVDAARGLLNKFLPDIYIYTDHHKGVKPGGKSQSPGFGLTLVAETKEGSFLCAECVSNPKGSEKGPSVPEDIGKEAATLLLEEIYRGGCVDSTNQSMAALFMVLGQQDVSKIQTGPLSPYTIQFLRHIRDFLEIMFKVEPEEKSEEEDLCVGGEKLILTCVGVGYTNVSKAIM